MNQIDITLVGCKAENLARLNRIKEISLLPSRTGNNYLLFRKEIRKYLASHAHLFRIPCSAGLILIVKVYHNQKLFSGRYMVPQQNNVISPALLHQFQLGLIMKSRVELEQGVEPAYVIDLVVC